MASVPTSFYSMWHYNCPWESKGLTQKKHDQISTQCFYNWNKIHSKNFTAMTVEEINAYVHCESKNHATASLMYDSGKCNHFQNSFTVGLSNKYVARASLYLSSHLKHVRTLPCEIFLKNSWNTFSVRKLGKQKVGICVLCSIQVKCLNVLLWHECTHRDICAAPFLQHSSHFAPKHVPDIATLL